MQPLTSQRAASKMATFLPPQIAHMTEGSASLTSAAITSARMSAAARDVRIDARSSLGIATRDPWSSRLSLGRLTHLLHRVGSSLIQHSPIQGEVRLRSRLSWSLSPPNRTHNLPVRRSSLRDLTALLDPLAHLSTEATAAPDGAEQALLCIERGPQSTSKEGRRRAARSNAQRNPATLTARQSDRGAQAERERRASTCDQ